VLSILTGETGQCSLLYVPRHPSAPNDDLKLPRTSTTHLTVAPEVPGPQLPILGSVLATGPHSAPNLVCGEYAGCLRRLGGDIKISAIRSNYPFECRPDFSHPSHVLELNNRVFPQVDSGHQFRFQFELRSISLYAA
jgi:hypothetical protein